MLMLLYGHITDCYGVIPHTSVFIICDNKTHIATGIILTDRYGNSLHRPVTAVIKIANTPRLATAQFKNAIATGIAIIIKAYPMDFTTTIAGKIKRYHGIGINCKGLCGLTSNIAL